MVGLGGGLGGGVVLGIRSSSSSFRTDRWWWGAGGPNSYSVSATSLRAREFKHFLSKCGE